MNDIAHHLATVLNGLPIAITLISPTGTLLGKAGSVAGLLGSILPSRDPKQGSRWSFTDRYGALIPRTDWPGARALRGECDFTGMIGTYRDDAIHTVRVVSVPTFKPDSEVAAVCFLQILDTDGCSLVGIHDRLPERLIDSLARAVANDWDNSVRAPDRSRVV